MVPSITKGTIMSNEKTGSIKTTTTESAKTTAEQGKVSVPAKATEQTKAPELAKVSVAADTMNTTGKVDSGAIKTASNAMESKSATVDLIDKVEIAGAGKKVKAGSAPTKMAIATEIYKRMWKVKDVTRKEIIEQFVAEAKLSKAGASTYFQLIKAAVK